MSLLLFFRETPKRKKGKHKSEKKNIRALKKIKAVSEIGDEGKSSVRVPGYAAKVQENALLQVNEAQQIQSPLFSK